MPLLFRESPLNSIWEGSGNVNALDVLRALGREPEVLEAWLTEVGLAQGEDPRLDRAIEGVLDDARRHHDARGLRPPPRRPDGGLPAGLAAGALRPPGDRRRVLRHPARRRLQRQRHAGHGAATRPPSPGPDSCPSDRPHPPASVDLAEKRQVSEATLDQRLPLGPAPGRRIGSASPTRTPRRLLALVGPDERHRVDGGGCRSPPRWVVAARSVSR